MAMRRKTLWLASGVLAAGLLLAGVICAIVKSGTEPAPPDDKGLPPPPRGQAEDGIREAVFRHQFRRYTGEEMGNIVFFIELWPDSAASRQGGALGLGTDPNEAFMQRFADHTPPVKPVSACHHDVVRGAFDKESGKRGVIFHVGTITWINDREVTVKGGDWWAALSAAGYVYTVEWTDGKWRVVSEEIRWIS